jgi:hypothetical protein
MILWRDASLSGAVNGAQEDILHAILVNVCAYKTHRQSAFDAGEQPLEKLGGRTLGLR